MADRYPSIYQRARKAACLTQEQAAQEVAAAAAEIYALALRHALPS